MTYIIAEPCIDVKDTTCVDVCPVDCIHPVKDETEAFEEHKQLYIDPEECIDCGASDKRLDRSKIIRLRSPSFDSPLSPVLCSTRLTKWTLPV